MAQQCRFQIGQQVILRDNLSPSLSNVFTISDIFTREEHIEHWEDSVRRNGPALPFGRKFPWKPDAPYGGLVQLREGGGSTLIVPMDRIVQLPQWFAKDAKVYRVKAVPSGEIVRQYAEAIETMWCEEDGRYRAVVRWKGSNASERVCGDDLMVDENGVLEP